MILDLSEEGMAMQTLAPLDANSIVPLHLSLGEPAAYLETTGYVAWADALGRAGVRFSELPDAARTRLRDWLTVNASAPSWKAPRWVVSERVGQLPFRDNNRAEPALRPSKEPTLSFSKLRAMLSDQVREIGEKDCVGEDVDVCSTTERHRVALSLETEPLPSGPAFSTTVQYEFNSLNGDLNSALTVIASRACSITRGTGAAVALAGESGMTCYAVAGANVPPVGAQVNVSAGFTGECVRQARALRCDDALSDLRADAEVCRCLGIRSILAAPILYERDLVGLLEVFCTSPYAFDEGDLAVVERLAQTVVLRLCRAEAFRQE
jgi:hypothetical protein